MVPNNLRSWHIVSTLALPYARPRKFTVNGEGYVNNRKQNKYQIFCAELASCNFVITRVLEGAVASSARTLMKLPDFSGRVMTCML